MYFYDKKRIKEKKDKKIKTKMIIIVIIRLCPAGSQRERNSLTAHTHNDSVIRRGQ